MRFPFRFMGVLSVAIAGWILYYVRVHPIRDTVTVGMEAISAAGLLAFGCWVIYRFRGSAA